MIRTPDQASIPPGVLGSCSPNFVLPHSVRKGHTEGAGETKGHVHGHHVRGGLLLEMI